MDGGNLELNGGCHTRISKTILPHHPTSYREVILPEVGRGGFCYWQVMSAFMSTFTSTVNAAPAILNNLKYISARRKLPSGRAELPASFQAGG